MRSHRWSDPRQENVALHSAMADVAIDDLSEIALGLQSFWRLLGTLFPSLHS